MLSICYSQFTGEFLATIGHNVDLLKSTEISRNNGTKSSLLTCLLFFHPCLLTTAIEFKKATAIFCPHA